MTRWDAMTGWLATPQQATQKRRAAHHCDTRLSQITGGGASRETPGLSYDYEV
ncbi:MAG: hypothetical protein LBE71_06380 [Dysgonamonadaceae bacterium]|nr:hypothetical protein [Dysgonamonadaceae bacterium]